MKVSVWMITYNHEKYIAQAIDSVLMQETDFQYEIVIGEDCSTDSTREVVIEYAQRYPERIRLVLSEKNLGMHGNGRRTLEACQGEYVAFLEGDDYWTSPHKLQKQVDFLDGSPEYVGCFHNATAVFENGSQQPFDYCSDNQKEVTVVADLLTKNFIPTCSVMYRCGVLGELPEWYSELPWGDWASHILHAQHGKIGYIDETMGVHRIHGGGVWTRGGEWSIGDFIKTRLDFLKHYGLISAHLGAEYDGIIRERVSVHTRELIEAYAQEVVDSIMQEVAEEPPQEVADRILDMVDRRCRDLPMGDVPRSFLLSRVYMALTYTSYRADHLTGVRHFWIRAIRHDPAWLQYRDAWSMGMEAFLGAGVAGFIRRTMKKALQSPALSSLHTIFPSRYEIK